ncbi:MAG: Tn3 family transposase [Sphingomonadales bacterium]|nr:Tn3 family transposase [Sphingomonadales bacterium]
MSNTSDIIPDVLSATDTHGVNHVNFHDARSVRIPVCPALCRVGKVINDMFDVKEESHRIQLRLKKPINTHRIAQHWDTIQRIAVSLKQRKTTQATFGEALGYKHNHPLLQALTEYNRLVKAIITSTASMMPV